MVNLKDMVVPNRDFQTSINIDFDFGDRSKIEGLIPTDSVCRYLEVLLRDVIVASNNRAKLLVGAYGKGKSHVVLAALTAMWIKEPESFQRIVEAYREHGNGFGDTLDKFCADGQRLLPVVISGSIADLRHSLLFALRTALRKADLESLMPQTNYDGAIKTLCRWRDNYPDTLARFEDLAGTSFEEAVSKLKNLDTETYDGFVDAYPDLTSGGTFDVLESSDVLEVYEHVLDGLHKSGIDGLYIVYDEFSKYLETGIDKATVEDTRLLQNLAEACNRSTSDRQLHLLLISHKSLSNYIDSNLPKEKVDGWRGVSGRFDEIEMADDANQYYKLIGSAIVKNQDFWDVWCADVLNMAMLDNIAGRYISQGLFGEDARELVALGCYPLHPLTSYLLPRLSEKVAQNERTLFTFICSGGERTLGEALEYSRLFVTPDSVYDYFEPLLRKEFYASQLHREYELARASLARLEADGLEAKIIKTIAVIDAVAQYDRVAPTQQTIFDLFTDCGYEASEVEDALNALIEGDSIVYLRRSNAFLKLKEASGVRIDQEVSDRAEALRSARTCAEILNDRLRGTALYPSRYNEDRGIVRYFDCGFVDSEALATWIPGTPLLNRTGDGEVVAVFCDDPDKMFDLKQLAQDKISRNQMTVVAFPREFRRIDDAVYRLEAAIELKANAGDDDILAEEYEIMIEDYSELVDGFIAGYFQPELKHSFYYIGGGRRSSITRKRKLSEELSCLCDKVFDKTPRITSEALNKNELTGTAFSSRTKILKALCAPTLVPNLGFVGNGQETSMARSALEKTGLIKDIVEHIDEEGNRGERITAVIDAIERFVDEADGSSFDVLYDELTSRDAGIGLRRGPIPLYLAFVLRGRRDEIKITKSNGEEKALDETLLDDISKQPGSYRITHLDWTPEMGSYINALGGIFGCKSSRFDRNAVVEAMRLWYVSLPQITRNSRYDHTHSGSAVKLSKTRTEFFRAIKRIDTPADRLLLEELPSIFSEPVGSKALVMAIRAEKAECDGYLTDSISSLAKTLIAQFEPDAPEGASLGAVLKSWVDANPAAKSHVFSGLSNIVLNAVKAPTGDDVVTVGRIAKAATSLRVDDWNDERFSDFLKIVSSMKQEVEGAADEASEGEAQQMGILFVGADGTAQRRTFSAVVTSRRSNLLKSQILACLDDMGGAVSPEEKRQVMFDVLRGLC